MSAEREALVRVQAGLFHLQRALLPFVETRLRLLHGSTWRDAIHRAPSAPPSASPDTYALLKTMIARWADVFRDAFDSYDRYRARSLVTVALDARNAAAHSSGGLADKEALGALDATHELLRLIKAPADDREALKQLYDAQRAIDVGLRRAVGPTEQPNPRSSAPADPSSPVRSKGVGGSHADRVLAYVRAHPGLDDDELSRHLGITPRQAINQIARRLERKGLIERRLGPRDKIVNTPASAKI